MSEVGHNSGGVSLSQLTAFVERVERLEVERAELAEQVKEVFAEAKGSGFCTKTMRSVIRARRKDPEDLDDERSLFDLYWSAVARSLVGDDRGAER